MVAVDSVAGLGVDRWRPGMTFGDFSEATVTANYS
jgi:hypothetical protein